MVHCRNLVNHFAEGHADGIVLEHTVTTYRRPRCQEPSNILAAVGVIVGSAGARGASSGREGDVDGIGRGRASAEPRHSIGHGG